jgi:hypothetical protein
VLVVAQPTNPSAMARTANEVRILIVISLVFPLRATPARGE